MPTPDLRTHEEVHELVPTFRRSVRNGALRFGDRAGRCGDRRPEAR